MRVCVCVSHHICKQSKVAQAALMCLVCECVSGVRGQRLVEQRARKIEMKPVNLQPPVNHPF